jgi:hypothetical protein
MRGSARANCTVPQWSFDSGETGVKFKQAIELEPHGEAAPRLARRPRAVRRIRCPLNNRNVR